MQRQVWKWSTGAQFACLSDVDVPGVECIPLKHDWSGWWAKLELFRPDMPTDFLYTDLDNVILGPIDELVESQQFIADIGFSFFRVTPDVTPDLDLAYGRFWDNPAEHMGEWDPETRRDGKFGDAAFLRWRCGLTPQKWSPRVVMNVVEMVPPCPWRTAPPGIPEDLRVMLCGGKRRRPWLSISQEVQRAYWCRRSE